MKWVLEGSCDTLPVPFLRRLVWKTCRLDQNPASATYADIALLLSEAETIAIREAYSKSDAGPVNRLAGHLGSVGLRE